MAEARLKDDVLNELAGRGNVAQFVSFDPQLNQRFAWIAGHSPNHRFRTIEEAVQSVLATAVDKSVNIRSFALDRSKNQAFLYGLRSISSVMEELRKLASMGLHTIVNETIDIKDGGVSGVVLGDLIEFAPGDTPRCVEKPGVASLRRQIGMRMLEAVYGFAPSLDFDAGDRVEFSIHPLRRGYRSSHTIIWEIESVGSILNAPQLDWPNLFSRFIGDKAFGLLVAHVLGFDVPHTIVVCRSVAPFSFGKRTGTSETWIRTCPVEPVPGKFTTHHGWLDPFKVLNREDAAGDQIASVLAQNGVEPFYSGAAASSSDTDAIIEGVRGTGQGFMVGMAPQPLPERVRKSVMEVCKRLIGEVGPCRFEWVSDEQRVWIVQLHRGTITGGGRVVHPGSPAVFHRFDVSQGLEALRTLVAAIKGKDEGVVLIGQVGITSHFGDVLRQAQVASRIEV